MILSPKTMPKTMPKTTTNKAFQQQTINSAHKSLLLATHKLSTRRQTAVVACVSMLIVAQVVCVLCSQANSDAPHNSRQLFGRAKRSIYEFADGAEQIVGKIKTTFSCANLGYGYYADVDNDCKIFHVCQSFRMSDGSISSNDWSFFCGNQTVFNQATLACSHPEDSVPCESARDFYHVNDYFGDVRAPSITDADLASANNLVAQAYGSRVTSALQQPQAAQQQELHSRKHMQHQPMAQQRPIVAQQQQLAEMSMTAATQATGAAAAATTARTVIGMSNTAVADDSQVGGDVRRVAASSQPTAARQQQSLGSKLNQMMSVAFSDDELMNLQRRR